ncbi:PREDICTED: SWI/SNF-related matrix-associated actin-dependent regulator of chromatin subfamily A-like protein 1 [Dinoponera quadriceps]|uniref:SWI/SNF-related matrix-associated actin-dependent regulator of chromatin subfamily A-like protein 1 n=1 Tax=Dinoponera quadriceps TaxID=609295 RepID=A0A6P3XM25_DINQU|nr:PREDICTED: SWI/SNF-related matrix-associated actin-dependent regulator of chromatin subfamily A-like protein 1 [Dinoponera quadriceps]
MSKMCSLEEIEKKRLLALQRRNQSQLKAQNNVPNSPVHKKISPNYNTNVVRHHKSNNRFNPIEPRNFFTSSKSVTGKCYMISDDRFALETSLYVPAIIETFKTVASKLYDPNSKIWNFHINDYDHLMQKLVGHESKISVTRIPQIVFQIFKKNLKSEKDSQTPEPDLSKIDETLMDTLMPFQRDGICYGISKGGRCLIADDMGLGKTIQALGIACYFRTNWPLLIVVPSSVRFQWSEAIYQFLPSIPTHYVHHFANTKDYIGDEKVTIISYDLLHRAVDVFEKHIYGFIILDESHVLKNSKTARFQAAQRICAQARHVVLLTGTPALSRPIELYSQISLIMPRFMKYEEYGLRYCAGQKNNFGWDFTGFSNMQELQLLLRITCMIRRLKVDILHQLPSKIRQMVILNPDLIKAGTREMRDKFEQMRKNTTGLERHNVLLQYYTESSIARLRAVCAHVKNLFERKIKCLLYAHHQSVLDAICNVAESMKIRYIRIDGKTTSEQRKYQVDKFQKHDDYLTAVLSLTAANAGITLTAAHHVVFTELFWNPGIMCQAEDRVHRIGQNKDVIIQYLVANNTADDHIWPLLKKKLNVLNAVGLEQDLTIKDIDISVQKQIGQQDLSSFVSISPSSSKEEENCSPMEDLASTSFNLDEFKEELIEVDGALFDPCDWDDM